MCNSKPLLFVNNQKPKVFKYYVGGKHSVCSNQHIHQPLF